MSVIEAQGERIRFHASLQTELLKLYLQINVNQSVWYRRIVHIYWEKQLLTETQVVAKNKRGM